LAKQLSRPPQPAGEPIIVNPRWLAAAFLATVLLAAFCGYAALCLLFYQGQWQLLFHPSRNLSSTPAAAGIGFDEVHFDVNDAGRPRLDGWWIPGGTGGPYAGITILYLHDARGSLSDCIPALSALHSLGVNVFAFDYRGFGRSAGTHPSERTADADTLAAWTYLTDLRHIPARNLVVYGNGVGATFAAYLATQFAPAAIILQDPNPSAHQVYLRDARARMLPLRFLQNETLDPTSALAAEHVPRLFLDVHGDSARCRALFEASSYPKQYFDLRNSPEPALSATVRRFLDGVLH
jgi:pimeloyl-ACP methyl ester carboxylesterase